VNGSSANTGSGGGQSKPKGGAVSFESLPPSVKMEVIAFLEGNPKGQLALGATPRANASLAAHARLQSVQSRLGGMGGRPIPLASLPPNLRRNPALVQQLQKLDRQALSQVVRKLKTGGRRGGSTGARGPGR
jgi:hypothetical protein